ncbi:complement component C8 alpha chain [Microcaecilia unicolor]|uniref:Complement component C8 alpha chain n=1 Tax=Microcaecilia unicolor TaxID=1415580 RepID=A0A6P7Y5S2_9AMPH|nr:complement component C8 alpha chain [Microcaecilia unicolor]
MKMPASNHISSLILLIIYFLSCLGTITGDSKLDEFLALRRDSRSADGTSAPVDCQLGQWAEWTPCFACQEKKYRHRRLQQPAKFEGRICAGYLWDEASCKTTERCVPQNQCGEDFQCEETGRCIKPHLRCNGEPDCRDASDERDCDAANDRETFCKTLFPIPGSEVAVRGFNILTQDEMQYVYDPTYYGGQCEYVYNGEWRDLKYDPTCERLYYGDDEKYFRKPYNFHLYQFQAHADSGFSSEYYEDARDLLNAIKKDKSFSIGLTLGISFSDIPVGVQYGVSSEKSVGSLQNITKHTEKNTAFIRFLTKVQTARFKMRRNNIALDEDFLLSLMELPERYNYGLYAKFINDYGTHFLTSGTMGGVYEYILVVDQDVMRAMELNSEQISSCFGQSLSVSVVDQDMGLETRWTTSEKKCKESGFLKSDSSEQKQLIKDVISLVRGGDTGSSAAFLHDINAAAYRRWGRSLKYNPVVIDFELQPIYEVVHRSQLRGMETRKQNMKKAFDEYINEFNACRCGPCQNNGEPILNGATCLCQCKSGYEGSACEKTSRTGTTADGSWSCWTAWSQCQAGTRRRTRECNNPTPKGGMWCIGKNAQTEYC